MADETRYQRRIRVYAERHGVSMQEARRHAQGTHARYHEPGTGRTSGILGPMQLGAYREMYMTRGGQGLRKIISDVAATDPKKRVSINLISKNGEVRKLFVNRKRGYPTGGAGAGSGWLKKKLGKTAGNAKGFVSSQSGMSDSDETVPELEISEIAEIQVIVYR